MTWKRREKLGSRRELTSMFKSKVNVQVSAKGVDISETSIQDMIWHITQILNKAGINEFESKIEVVWKDEARANG